MTNGASEDIGITTAVTTAVERAQPAPTGVTGGPPPPPPPPKPVGEDIGITTKVTTEVVRAEAPTPGAIITSLGTVTEDITEDVKLPVGSHFATLQTPTETKAVPITDAEYKAGIKVSEPAIKFRAAPPPTPAQERVWTQLAKEAGIDDTLAYVQQRWMGEHGLTAEGIARADKIVPGVTMEQQGKVVPVPPAGTLAETPAPGQPVKIFAERGKVVTLDPHQASQLFRAEGIEQFERMREYGLIAMDSKFVPGKDERWSYIPATAAKAQQAMLAEREASLRSLSEYRLPAKGVFMQEAGAPPVMSDSYDIAAYLYDHPSDTKTLILTGFDPKMVEDYAKALKALKPYTDKQGNIDLSAAILADVPDRHLNTVFKKEDVKEAQGSLALIKGVQTETKEFVERVQSGDVRPSDIFKAELLQYKNAIVMLPIGAARIEAEILPEWRGKMQRATAGLPKTISVPASVVAGLAVGGLLQAPLYTAMFTLTLAGLPMAPNKAAYAKEVGQGIGTYFTSIPGRVKADPAYTVGNLIGVFVLGPGGILKLAKGAVAKTSPWYMPNQGMRFSFTTSKIATKSGDVLAAIKAGKITETSVARAVGNAIDRALKEPAQTGKAKIGRSNIYVRVDATPTSKHLGGILWHAAPRFALTSARGIEATKPCLLMIYTKSGLRLYPSSIQYANKLSSMSQLGFQYLGSGRAKPGAYGPIKTYLGRFENEALFAPNTKLYRVKNLHSRILGASAGEFVTSVDGWILPIFRFSEGGARVPAASLAKLAAVRVETIYHSLKVLFGKKGFKAEKMTMERLTELFDEAGKKAAKGKKGKAYEQAYAKVVDEAMAERLRRAYEPHRAVLERLWRQNPERFERAYRERLYRNIAKLYGVRVPRFRAEPRYTVRLARDRALEYNLVRVRAERLREQLVRVNRVQYRLPRSVRVARRTVREVPPRTPPPRTPPPPRIPPPRIPPPKPPPPPRLTKEEPDKAKREAFTGAIAWRQGFGWWAIKAPYRDEDKYFFKGEPPPNAIIIGKGESPYQTIQTLTGKPPPKLRVDMGIQDVTIEKPTRKPGRAGAIRFEQDIGQRTRGDISIGSNLVSVKKGKVFHTRVPGGTLLSRTPLRGAKVRRRQR